MRSALMAIVPLQDELAFGLVFSVLFQELFRFLIYKLLRKAEYGLKKVAENTERITDNKHILAYVAGLGFGIISGAFSLVNVLANAIGPATVGLQNGSQYFFFTSSATALCFILLHTFWGVIFFSGMDTKNYARLAIVVCGHMFVSCMTLFNKNELYAASLTPAFVVTFVTAIVAFRVAGGSFASFREALKCRRWATGDTGVLGHYGTFEDNVALERLTLCCESRANLMFSMRAIAIGIVGGSPSGMGRWKTARPQFLYSSISCGTRYLASSPLVHKQQTWEMPALFKTSANNINN
ncbi:unnamed protein product [Timema podura]|uniref:Gamma-secretase subunit Aph-1 n=1 Tax=Timema podura TaxID=61482 RepID=A0ABN7NZ69_TIMPD|nr:unnamed protein product [Timema podura]